MKKFRFLLAILALVLVFGLAFTGCDGGVKDAPELKKLSTALRSGTSGNFTFTAATSFTTSQAVSFVWDYYSPYQDLARVQVVIKEDGDIRYATWASFNYPKRDTVMYNAAWTPWSYPAGSYTAEVYIEDIDGKKSNTLTTSFTVTP